MATTPTTLVIFTEDRIHFPINTALVVMKQLFQYGVKDIYAKGDKIFISLSYSPKGITLKRKFGNLPIRYMRTRIEREDEFKMLESVVRRFKFNLLDEDQEENAKERVKAISSSSGKKTYYLNPPSLDDIDDDNDEDDDDVVQVVKKQKLSGPSPQALTATTSSVHSLKKRKVNGDKEAAAAAASSSSSLSVTAPAAATIEEDDEGICNSVVIDDEEFSQCGQRW